MPERLIQVDSVGKTITKILIGIALIVTAGMLLPVVLAAYGVGFLSYALVAIQLLGVSTVFNAFAPDMDMGASRLLAENLSIFSSPTAIRSIPFGRVGVSGQILYRENIKKTGDDPDELLIILGLAGYPATSLEKFWLNETLVFDGDSTTGPGAITTGKFGNDLWVWFRTGEETSGAFPGIATLSTTWNDKVRKLRGIPCIGIRLKIREHLDSKFQPLAQIKGAKLYDPRLDSTVPGGSGAHRFADPSTWEWSENPKLAELLYLRGADVNGTNIFGMGKAVGAIDLENFASEANICEEQIDVVGATTIDRYTLNGRLMPSDSHKANLQRLLSASAGTMDASGGIYRTFAGAWRASSMTLTESDIDGAPTEMQLQIDPSKEVNVISGAFAEPDEMWVVKEYPELTDATSVAAFGENAKKLDLPFTTDHRIAQRIAKIQMKRFNAKRSFNANYWLRSVSLQPGDIITQTYSRYKIVAETFRVDFWAIEPSEDREGNRRLLVSMRLVEELQSWFDWDYTTEEKSINAGGFLPAMGALRLTEVFYIKPTEGTAIQNGVGTLTVEAHRIYAGVDELLSTGTIQVYEGTTLITVANGYAAGSDGYTGVFDSGDITGFAIVELKDGPSGAILDTITLVDIADGGDAIYGSIDPENGLAWTRAPNSGSWTPAQQTSDLDCTFYQAGVAVARIARRVTLTSGDGALAATTTVHKDGDLNTGRVTVTVSGGGSMAINVEFAYSFGGELATVAETLKSVLGGDDGATGGTGDSGLSVYVANVYKRSVTPPSTPGVDDGSYNFTTNVLTPPTGWAIAIPTGTDPLYTSEGSFSIVGPTGIDTTVTWGTPTRILDGGPSTPVLSTIANYDDLDLALLAAGKGRYAMLTDRSTSTSGSQNNFQDTDGILINKTTTDDVSLALYYSHLKIGARITFWISNVRWFVFEIDELMGTVGTGATTAYKFGVVLVQYVDPTPDVNWPTTSGNPVLFQLNKVLRDETSLVFDPDFDLSNDMGPDHFWNDWWNWKFGGGTTFNLGGGANGSNSITVNNGSVMHSTRGVMTSNLVRTNSGAFEFRIKYKTSSAGDRLWFNVWAGGWASPDATAADSISQVTITLPGTSGVWTDLVLVVEIAGSDASQYWNFGVYFGKVGELGLGQSADFDSIFVYPIPPGFGSNVVGTKVISGAVPESDTVTDADKVLQADGTWVTNVGGGAPVDSVFGRTGAVTAEQADYDSFFLTPSEGVAAFLGISATAVNSQLLDSIDSTGFARLGTTSPALNYLYTARSSASSAFYVRQGSTGIIARLFKDATPGSTGATAPRFEVDNDGRPSVTGLAVPHYITTGYVSGKISVQATAPSSPTKGDIWFDTS